jgi:hypothetical protein
MRKNHNKNEVGEHRRGRLTILQLMAVLAMLGIFATWILHSFIHVSVGGR